MGGCVGGGRAGGKKGGRGKGCIHYNVTYHSVIRHELEFQVISHGDESSLIAHLVGGRGHRREGGRAGKGLFSLQSNSPQSYT